jgi:RNA polymerase sigma-70 factor (sigma-E family)
MIRERGGQGQSRDDEFERFVHASYPGLVRLGFLLTGDRGRGEDLVQTALVKVFGSWGSLRSTDAAGAYTRTVMVRDASRWRRRRWAGETPGTLVDVAAAGDGIDGMATADAVRRALQELPVAQRAVVVLRYFEQRSEGEIGEILGISAGTVKSRASRALARLREGGLLDEHVLEEG